MTTQQCEKEGEAELEPEVARSMMNRLWGERTRGRRQTELFLCDLERCETNQQRIRSLGALVGGEVALGHHIAQLEQNLLRLDISQHHFDSDAMQQLKMAIKAGNIVEIVSIMSNPILLHQVPIQECALQGFRRHWTKSSRMKSDMVNAGVIPALVATMQRHASVPHIQREAAILLLNLPFLDNETKPTVIYHANGTVECMNKDGDRNHQSSSLDMSIVELLFRADAFQVILEAIESDLFQVQESIRGDEVGNYERTMAKLQLPLILRKAMLQASKPGDLFKTLRFLRQCMASFLSDPTAAPHTLSSFLYRKANSSF